MDTRSTIQMLRDAADAFEAGAEQDEASAYDARALYLEGLLANAYALDEHGYEAGIRRGLNIANDHPASTRPAAAPVEAGPVCYACGGLKGHLAGHLTDSNPPPTWLTCGVCKGTGATPEPVPTPGEPGK